MGMLWKRCFSQDKRYWRRTYKVCFISEHRTDYNTNERAPDGSVRGGTD